ncbi:pilus (MSHA type) biogenesis protein MshL [Aquabacterium lacunae]|nr:pilus (MSHA type) biogenesis protein MshL [Aquabacterium lacunae]
MKSSQLILGVLTAAVLLAHAPAEAGKQRKARPQGWHVVASMHLKVSQVATPDLDHFPAVPQGGRHAPLVGSRDALQTVQGMSISLGSQPKDSTQVQTPMAPVTVAALSAPTPLTPDLQLAARGRTGMAAPSTLSTQAAQASMAARASAGAEGRFDLVVNQAPASQVFLQLGGSGPYNILVPPDLGGSVSISLRNTTVMEALEALRELYGYDFKLTGNRVFVYPNDVQTRMFKISYLPGRRQGVSDLRVQSSSIVQAPGSGSSASGSSGGGGNASGAGKSATALEMSAVSMTSDTDFWRDVRDSLNSLVNLGKGSAVTINPGAGVIVVRGTPAELRQVGEYLKAVQITIERQVMLEAKIVEVQLNSAAQTGVNWSAFRGVNSGSVTAGIVGVAPGQTVSHNGALSNSSATVNPASSVVTEALGKGFYGLAFQGANFAALLSFLESQGKTQVLSSPRIAALNNQKAVLKVGTDELFLTNVKSNLVTTATGTVNSPELTLQPFFSGISLDVTPQIDDRGGVMLHVHPAISVVAEKQKTFDLGSNVLRLPLATSSINETDSIVRVLDGQIVAIGGLMQQYGTQSDSGIPVVSDVPVLGNAFKYKEKTVGKRELVILIKPTIISADGSGWSDAQPEANLLPR